MQNLPRLRVEGRMAQRIAIQIGWFIAASLLSLSIGLLFVNIAQAGAHLNMPLPAPDATTHLKTGALNAKDILTRMLPSSIADAMAENQIMQILVFSLFFGTALGKVPGAPGAFLKRVIDGLMETMLRATSAVMIVAPLGIFAAISSVVTVQGFGVVLTCGKLIGWFYIALLALWTVLYFAGRAVLGRRMPELLRSVREPIMIAFSTASSEAAYPVPTESLRIRCAQAAGRLRAAARLFVQPGPIDGLSGIRGGFHCAGVRRAHADRPADHHAADPHNQQQRHGCRAQRLAGASGRDPADVRAAEPACCW